MSAQAQSPDELFDIVDEHDQVIGQATRAQAHAQRLFHRAVHIFVFREDGAVLMQQRSMLKDTSPGKWTSSCSGHVDAGESYDEAAVRELSEEINLKIKSAEELTFIGKHEPCRATGNEFVHLYTLTTKESPVGDPLEVEKLLWMQPEEVNQRLASEAKTFSSAFSVVWGMLQAG